MTISRRDFVATSAAGVAGLYVTHTGALAFAQGAAMPAEDGYKLWLRYAPPGDVAAAYRRTIRQVVVEGTSRTRGGHPQRTLDRRSRAMLGAPVPAATQGVQDGALVVGTPKNSAAIRGLNWDADLDEGRARGLRHPPGARSRTIRSSPIASEGEIGALYGAFHFLRLHADRTADRSRSNVTERPKVQLRMLNHWDNLNGTIERGYAGRRCGSGTICPATISPRYADYARANASIGINGAVINNVNADGANPLLAGVPAEGRGAGRRSGGRTACACICRPTSPRRSRSAG